MTAYIEFPAREEILEKLFRIDYGWPPRERIYENLARRLENRTMESAAFSFMLIELLHREREAVGEELSVFLPKCVLALTEDEDLARSARAALRELEPSAE